MEADSGADGSFRHTSTIDWYVNITDTSPRAICYDCLYLIGFFRTVESVFHLEYEMLYGTEHIGADDYALVKHWRYVPRGLCFPLAVDDMTWSPTEFQGPGCGIIVSETRHAGGRYCMYTCLTPPGICSAGGSLRPLVGRRAFGGGPKRHTD